MTPAGRVDTAWVTPAGRVDTAWVTPANRVDLFGVSSSRWLFLLGFGDRKLIAAYQCPGTGCPALERCAIKVICDDS